MNILILRELHPNPNEHNYPGGRKGGACYLTDMLLHGLRQKFGNTVVDHHRPWWMYDSEYGPGKLDDNVHKVFSLGRTLDDTGVDRTDIDTKIKDKFYDLIIFGYTHNAWNREQFNLATQLYNRNQIAFIDGGDLWEDGAHGIVDKCVYFKREFYYSNPKMHTISFAMPDEKIDTCPNDNKTILLAPMDPRDPSSYIYKQEGPYYQQYADSLFGVTKKKGGWDCVRHYEILANNCIPWFMDLESCPKDTITTLPKTQLLEVVKLVREKGMEWFTTDTGFDCWELLNDQIQTHFKKYCTTSALANYVLETCINN
jgi:hypothetical protein